MNDLDFRLPASVRPQRYDLAIEVDLDAWQFRGSEEIEVIIGEPTADITLHAAELELAAVRACLPDGTQLSGTVALNPVAETATLRFPHPLPAGTARLRPRLPRRDPRPAARLLPLAEGRRRAMRRRNSKPPMRAAPFPASTSPSSRRASRSPSSSRPTWPRSPTAPSSARARARWRAQARSVSPKRRRSRRIWSRITVGPYDATPDRHDAAAARRCASFCRAAWPTRACTRATRTSARSTYLEDYTAIPYPYGKVDAIGVPDFEAGAMENPGAITYRLTAIAADSERASTPALKSIFYTAAHELTHMWWGDLVTMAWWDDLWLNESFATFIGYKVVADLMPEWGMWRDFVATLARPFALDALVSTHPISFEVKNAKQATERFDVITYWKGAGVVRMIEGFLGAEAFRARCARVPPALPRAQRHRRRLLARAQRRVRTRRGRHRACLDHAAGTSTVELCRHRRATAHPAATFLRQPRPPAPGPTRQCGRRRS